MKLFLLLSVVAAVTQTPTAGRAETQEAYSGPLFPSGKTHALEGAFSLRRFDYKEKIDPPQKSTESGWLPGLGASYRHHGGVYERIALEGILANTNYDGSDQQGNPLLLSTRNAMIQGEGNLGISFLSLSRPPRAFVLYSGLGYRFWERSLGGAAPYREHYAWKYVPLGLRGDYRANPEFAGAVDVSLRIMFGGTIDVFLSDIDPGYNDLHLGLGNKPGFHVEAPFYLRQWSLTPWYEYSAIGRSNEAAITYYGSPTPYAAHEPSSTTHQFGLTFGARMIF